jgi:hypothetical protein
MALPIFAPVERSRKIFAAKSTKAILRLVPELRPVDGEKASDRIFFGLIGVILIVGLLGLLGINILLGNDAVRIRDLKLEAIQLTEEREAALREIAQLSDPANLAIQATSFGMVENAKIRFIYLEPNHSKVGG